MIDRIGEPRWFSLDSTVCRSSVFFVKSGETLITIFGTFSAVRPSLGSEKEASIIRRMVGSESLLFIFTLGVTCSYPQVRVDENHAYFLVRKERRGAEGNDGSITHPLVPTRVRAAIFFAEATEKVGEPLIEILSPRVIYLSRGSRLSGYAVSNTIDIPMWEFWRENKDRIFFFINSRKFGNSNSRLSLSLRADSIADVICQIQSCCYSTFRVPMLLTSLRK